MSDNINSPKHYVSHESGIECIEIVRYLPYSLGNAIKYLWRAGLKTANKLEDYKKALWYLNDFKDKIDADLIINHENIALNNLSYFLQRSTKNDLLNNILKSVYNSINNAHNRYENINFVIIILETQIKSMEQELNG